MIKKIRLENFLAHGSTELEFDEGVTVLTGPNNSGKSSIVEALRCIATNPAPKNFIRHGAKKAKVELELENDVRVIWIREKGHARYEVYRSKDQEEPEVYAKFGRKPPEDILELIRLNPVPLEAGNSLDVHIGNQRSPVFLLDQSSGVAAQFFAASSEAAHLLAMQTELKAKIKDAKRDNRKIEVRMQEICSELDAMQTLPDVELELETAREIKVQLDAHKRSLPVIEKILSRFELLKSASLKSAGRIELLDKASPAPQLFQIANLKQVSSSLVSLSAQLKKSKSRAAVLQEIGSPPELFDSYKLASTIDNSTRISKSLNVFNLRKKRLDNLFMPPEIFNTHNISTMIRKVLEAKLFRDRVGRRAEMLKDIPVPPELFDVSGLSNITSRINKVKSAMSKERTRLEGLEKNRAELESVIRERLSVEGQCPLCGAEFDADRFMEDSK
ncbi:AAA family ATPase [Maridesulfovibrio bastinii]|uniref:AAA family ATPase n=1 Tax=Maridesulfovibrio bastinii TaxID=47157 RepID=UPI0003F8F923|nr:AAA family ATPase [Maridesulfovibrio bastinii]